MTTALETIFSPIVLFFGLGFFAGLVRSDLSIPESIAKGLALYLMLAIGFKGGVEVTHAGLSPTMLSTIAAGAVASFGLPLVAFGLLQVLTKLDRINAASIAAHYGSISVVTFVAGTQYVSSLGLQYDGFLVAVVAVMETPAILSGLWLAGSAASAPDPGAKSSGLLREALFNGSVVLLVGSFVIGLATGDDGYHQIDAFIDTPFKGVLCFFLLDMGIAAASRIRGAQHLRFSLVAFGLLMPMIGALVGLMGAFLIGLSVGSGALFVTLCASASYIAVPAAMRVALPQANPAYSLTLSLGVTFPFNLIIGIPTYVAAASRILG